LKTGLQILLLETKEIAKKSKLKIDHFFQLEGIPFQPFVGLEKNLCSLFEIKVASFG